MNTLESLSAIPTKRLMSMFAAIIQSKGYKFHVRDYGAGEKVWLVPIRRDGSVADGTYIAQDIDYDPLRPIVIAAILAVSLPLE